MQALGNQRIERFGLRAQLVHVTGPQGLVLRYAHCSDDFLSLEFVLERIVQRPEYLIHRIVPVLDVIIGKPSQFLRTMTGFADDQGRERPICL
jgi:hypothetical protein